MRSSRRLVQLLGIPLLVWTISIPVAEFAYRGAGVRLAETIPGVLETFGPGWTRHRPNLSLFNNWFSGTFWIHTDARGFRVASAASPEQPATTDVDILVLGDSQALGQGLDYGESVIGVFENNAQKAGLQVGNAAVGGHWLQEQVALCEHLIKDEGLRPQAVLLCLTPRSISNPDGGDLATAKARLRAKHGAQAKEPTSFLSRARAWLKENTALYLVVRNALRSAEERERPWQDARKLYLSGPVLGKRERALLEHVRKLQALAGGIGAKTVICYMPLELDFRIEALARAREEAPSAISGRAPRRIAGHMAEALGGPLIDLTDVLQGRINAGHPVTLRGDPHYNQPTSQAAGTTIWSAVDWVSLCR